MRRSVALLVVAATTLACSTRVDRVNPFDPTSPPGLLAPASVSGTVVGELADGSSGPIAGALVTVEGGAGTALTDDQGAFSLALSPGSHLLRLSRDRYLPASLPVLELAIGEARALDGAVLLSLARGRLTGTVRLSDREDAGGIQVAVTGTGVATVTASDGRFELDRVLVGTVELVASREGYARTVLGTFNVSTGGTVAAGDHVIPRVDGRVSIQEGAATRSRTVTVLTVGGAAVRFRMSEDPTFTDAAVGDAGTTARPYPPAAPDARFTLGDRDGVHTIYVAFSDGTSWGLPSSASIVLDRVAPDLASVVIGAGTGFTRTVDGLVPLTLSAADLPPPGTQAEVSGLAQMVIANAADFSGASTHPYNVSAAWALAAGTVDGPKQVFVKFVDGAGNESLPATATVIRDTAGPGGVSLSLVGPPPAPAGYTGSPFVTARLSASDANGGAGGNADLQVRLSNDAGMAGASWLPFRAESSWALTPGDAVAKTVWAELRDPAGNVSGPVSAQITLAETPPSSPTLQLEGGAPRTASRAVTLAVSAVGAADLLVSVGGVDDPAGWRPYATLVGADLGAADEQNKVVTVRFRNAARVEGPPASASIWYDRTPPAAGTLTLTGTLANGTTSSTVSSSPVIVASPRRASADATEMALAQASDPGCAGAFASPVWQPYAPQVTFVLVNGPGDPKLVCAIFRDATGNVDPTAVTSAGITLDTDAPANPVFTDLVSGVTRAYQVGAHATAIQPGETFQCFGGQYGGAWTDCGTSPAFTFTLTPNAENTLGVRARDAAYNVSAGSLVRIVHDDIPPVPPYITSLYSVGSSINVSWSPSESADVAAYAVAYGTMPGDVSGTGAAQGPSAVQVGVQTSLRLDGLVPGQSYYVSVTATDAAGNVSEPSGERIIVPNVVAPRLLSTYGADVSSVGLRQDGAARRAYVAQRQGLVQLDVTGPGAPVVRGRVPLSGVVPHRGDALPVVACTVDGTAGDCVYVAGSTLESDYRTDPTYFRTGVSVIFFPAAAVPGTGGRPVASLDARAERLVLSPDRSTLFAIEAAQVRAYSIASPAAPVPLGPPVAFRDPAGATVRWLSKVHGAGLVVVGGIPGLYVLASPAGGAPTLYRFDATNPAALVATNGTVLASPIGTPLTVIGGYNYYNPAAYTHEPVTLFEGGLYVAYTSLDTRPCAGNPGGTGTWAVEAGRWVPGGASFASGRPEAVYTLASGPFTCNTADPAYNQPGENLGVAVGIGRDLADLEAFYLFTSPRGASGVTARRLVPAGGGLALQGTVSSAASGGPPWSVAVLPAVQTGGVDALLLAGPGPGTGGDYASRVFSQSGGPAPSAPAVAYAELASDTFVATEGFLFMKANSTTMQTLDVSNPLDPHLVATHGSATSISLPVIAAGPLLAWATTGGADLHLLQPDGTLVDRGLVAVASGVRAMTFAGGRLYAANAGTVYVYDVSQATDPAVASPSYPLVTTLATPVNALDVRGHLLWVASDTTLRAFTISGATLTPFGTPVTIGGAIYLSVRGSAAVVSTIYSSQIVDVSNPASPVLTVPRADVAGPVAIHGGYVVGLAAFSSTGSPDSGPRFVSLDGTLHGTQPFAACGTTAVYFTTSLAWDRGSYLAYCQRNGLNVVTAVNPASGALADEVPFAVPQVTSEGAFSPLALEGATAYLGGTNGNYLADLRGLASGAGVGAPYRRYLGGGASHLVQSRGTLWSLLGSTGLGTVQLWSYDTTDLTTAAGDWPLTVTTELSAFSHPSAVATDGQTLWAAAAECYGNVAAGSNANCLARGTGLWAVDARATGSAPALANYASLWPGLFSSVAYQRRSLYAAFTPNAPAGAATVVVWDVSSATTPVRLADVPVTWSASSPAGYVTMTRLRDLAVSGSLLVFTYDGAAGAPAFGMGFVRLGARGDGSGATFLGTYESPLPLGSPVFAGDLLYARHNAGLAAFDLRPYFARGDLPRYIGSRKTAEVTYTPTFARLEVEGPFAFLLANSLRVFDLR